jgi:hypothetical protein
MVNLKQRLAFLMVSAGFIWAPSPAAAHHGLAEFDQASVTLKGTVTEFHFTNPHCVVEFEVKSGNSKVETWQAEMTSPAHLKGWTPTSLAAGDEVTITGYRAKSGAHYMWITSLKSSNGVELKTNGRNLIPDAR